MGWPVGMLQASMGHAEYMEWRAYYQMEPWDETRADWRAGMIAAVIANVNRGKDQRVYKPDEFMPRFGQTPAATAGNWKAMQERLRMAAGRNKRPHPSPPQIGEGVEQGKNGVVTDG